MAYFALFSAIHLFHYSGASERCRERASSTSLRLLRMQALIAVSIFLFILCLIYTFKDSTHRNKFVLNTLKKNASLCMRLCMHVDIHSVFVIPLSAKFLIFRDPGPSNLARLLLVKLKQEIMDGWALLTLMFWNTVDLKEVGKKMIDIMDVYVSENMKRAIYIQIYVSWLFVYVIYPFKSWPYSWGTHEIIPREMKLKKERDVNTNNNNNNDHNTSNNNKIIRHHHDHQQQLKYVTTFIYPHRLPTTRSE